MTCLLPLGLMVLNGFLMAAEETASRQGSDGLKSPGTPVPYSVALQADGLLVGRVGLIDAESGEWKPVWRVRVCFVKNGKIVTLTRPDKTGRFQATRLLAGVYSVVVAGRDGMAALSIRVLPTGQDTTGDSLVITVAPAVDFRVFSGLVGLFPRMPRVRPAPVGVVTPIPLMAPIGGGGLGAQRPGLPGEEGPWLSDLLGAGSNDTGFGALPALFSRRRVASPFVP